MNDFDFTFESNGSTYKASCYITNPPPVRQYNVTLQDQAQQDLYGTVVKFKEDNGMYYHWDVPDVKGAKEFLRDVLLGLRTHLESFP
jgi:hypothetical protein